MHRPSLTEENAILRLGQGDWAPFNLEMPVIEEAARDWARQLAGVEKPWLCWNISPSWCLLQQRLVRHIGWTPVVGFDPKYGLPPLVDNAVLIDFNSRLRLPQMYMIFPVEFAWLFAPRLAFWHSDLLCRIPFLTRVAAVFDKLNDGEMSAVWDYGGRSKLFDYKSHRYYEVLGCMSRGASRDNFDKGCGWWRNTFLHPNVATRAERAAREKICYDNGYGVMYWKRRYGGVVRSLSLREPAEGHCSEIGNSDYRNLPDHYEAERNTGREMELNYDLEQVCKRLGIERFL